MDTNSFIAALVMQKFYVTNNQLNITTLMQDTILPKINGLYITMHHTNSNIESIKISKIFSPTADTYYDIDKAYKIILESM